MAGGLGLFAVAVVVVRCWRSDDRRSFVRTRWRGPAGCSPCCWLAPLADQIRHDPGNIRRLIDHFTSPDEDGDRLAPGGRTCCSATSTSSTATSRLFTGTQRFLQVGYEPDGPDLAGRRCCSPCGSRAFVVAVRLRHRTLIALHVVIAVTLAAVARVDGADLRQDLVLPHVVGVGDHDAAARRDRLDRLVAWLLDRAVDRARTARRVLIGGAVVAGRRDPARW